MLLVALGWKIAIQPDDPNYLKEDLIKFLERNHFSVVVTGRRQPHAICRSEGLPPMDRTGISFGILLQAQIARSSSFAARCTPNSQYYGQY